MLAREPRGSRLPLLAEHARLCAEGQCDRYPGDVRDRPLPCGREPHAARVLIDLKLDECGARAETGVEQVLRPLLTAGEIAVLGRGTLGTILDRRCDDVLRVGPLHTLEDGEQDDEHHGTRQCQLDERLRLLPLSQYGRARDEEHQLSMPMKETWGTQPVWKQRAIATA